MRLTTLFETMIPSFDNNKYEDGRSRYHHICSKLKFLEKQSASNVQKACNGITVMMANYGEHYTRSKEPEVLAFLVKLQAYEDQRRVDAKTIKSLESAKKSYERGGEYFDEDEEDFFGTNWMDD